MVLKSGQRKSVSEQHSFGLGNKQPGIKVFEKKSGQQNFSSRLLYFKLNIFYCVYQIFEHKNDKIIFIFLKIPRPWSIPSRFTMTSTTCPRHLSTGSILSSELSAVQSKQHNLTPSTTIAALLLLSSQFFLITVG